MEKAEYISKESTLNWLVLLTSISTWLTNETSEIVSMILEQL